MKKLIILCGPDNEQLRRVLFSLEFKNCSLWPWPEVNEEDGLPLPHSKQYSKAYQLIDLTVPGKKFTTQLSTSTNTITNTAGVPVVLCTQSLIIFTAIRVGIYHKRISHQDVELRWYEKDSNDSEPMVLPIDKDARMSHRPYGFFDTYEQLLMLLCTPREDG